MGIRGLRGGGLWGCQQKNAIFCKKKFDFVEFSMNFQKKNVRKTPSESNKIIWHFRCKF